MKRLIKYLGIVLVVLVLLVLTGYVLGKLGIADDELLLRKFQEDSRQFYTDSGNFKDFCSSALYLELKAKYKYSLSCTDGQSIDGGDLQIVAESAYGSWLGCKVTTFPPENGAAQKGIFCVEIPAQIAESLR